MVGREASTVPYHSSGCVCRAGRARRAPEVDRPGRHPAGRDQRTDGRARRCDPRFRRRRRRRAVQRHPGPLSRRRRGAAPRARPTCHPAGPGQRGGGLAGAGVAVTDAPVFAPTGASQPARPVPGFPSPTCRSSCRRGCSWRPPPRQSAPASLPPSRTATRRDATRTTSQPGAPCSVDCFPQLSFVVSARSRRCGAEDRDTASD